MSQKPIHAKHTARFTSFAPRGWGSGGLLDYFCRKLYHYSDRISTSEQALKSWNNETHLQLMLFAACCWWVLTLIRYVRWQFFVTFRCQRQHVGPGDQVGCCKQHCDVGHGNPPRNINQETQTSRAWVYPSQFENLDLYCYSTQLHNTSKVYFIVKYSKLIAK